MNNKEKNISAAQKEALKAAKEITVKFIETGRISPASFPGIFPSIYSVVLASLVDEPHQALPCSAMEEEDDRP